MNTWFASSPHWILHHKVELLSATVSPPSDVTFLELTEKSSNFPREFPIDTVRCHQLSKKNIPEEVLERNINSTYPVMHEHALYLCSVFLGHQKRFGNRDFYQNMTLLELIDRLLSKRAVAFWGEDDHYLLLDGTTGGGGWENVGTREEKQPLVLENCLSYDEMKLSALLSISSHTVFINDGHRENRGAFEDDRSKVEDNGVIIGLIGTQLTKEYVMEHREVIKTEEQNDHKYGYGQFFVPTLQGHFLNFYGDASLTYRELLPTMQNSPNRYIPFKDGSYFDKVVYRRRIALSIDTLLIEANDRAKKLNKMAYIHVVGLSSGKGKLREFQDELFMDTFAERLTLLSDVLTNVSDVCFAYIGHKKAGEYKHGKIGKIKLIMVDKERPHVKLQGEDAGKLLVVSYAGGSNSLPGNEFWRGFLHASDDSAAASSTQVAELHNWHINGRVRGENLKVATLKGLVTFAEYQNMHRND